MLSVERDLKKYEAEISKIYNDHLELRMDLATGSGLTALGFFQYIIENEKVGKNQFNVLQGLLGNYIAKCKLRWKRHFVTYFLKDFVEKNGIDITITHAKNIIKKSFRDIDMHFLVKNFGTQKRTAKQKSKISEEQIELAVQYLDDNIGDVFDKMHDIQQYWRAIYKIKADKQNFRFNTNTGKFYIKK